jgi:hypothetical protein
MNVIGYENGTLYVYPYSYYHETDRARQSGISLLANAVKTVHRYVLLSLIAPVQTEMYYMRMYPKHPKVTRHEKVTPYVGGYYNPNSDPKQIHYI